MLKFSSCIFYRFSSVFLLTSYFATMIEPSKFNKKKVYCNFPHIFYPASPNVNYLHNYSAISKPETDIWKIHRAHVCVCVSLCVCAHVYALTVTLCNLSYI